MLQINYIKQYTDIVKEKLAVKNFGNINLVDEIITLDEEIRKQKAVTENLQASINTASKEIGALMAKGNTEEATSKRNDVAAWKESFAAGKTILQQLEEDFTNKILLLPNLPHTSVPAGKTPEENVT
ncbi:MAG: serine--tRNA ligase, partial [Ferruginibacter sp.]|nr:serine--tRNA ligase [Ferruginibacter sp.]